MLVLDPGDVNLTFKRYLESPVTLTIERDYVIAIEGQGTDAELMRRYFAAWGDREAYATSHVGWGMNPRARYEALAMYDQRETNGTELRAFAGNFLYSTGANEFAGRFTEGHFDLPVRGCTITLDGRPVVEDGRARARAAMSTHLRSAGRAPPLVFLHGIGGDAACWRPQLELLSAALSRDRLEHAGLRRLGAARAR